MPLPWKKPRVGTISRLVTDLQSSPKHGNSLVVQTGFPASLVDLFYKNRDRLKKPYSSKKKNARRNQAAAAVDDDVVVVSDPIDGNRGREGADLIDGGGGGAAESSGGSGIEEIVIEEEVVVVEKVNERGQQICKDRTRKRIMRKLVPKKLRHKKKGGLVTVEEKETEIKEEEAREQGNSVGGRKGKLLISDVLEKRVNSECEDGIVVNHDVRTEREQRKLDDGESCVESQAKSKSTAACIAEEGQKGIERNGSSAAGPGRLILPLAVLVGLAGGRILALLLAIAACLMLKFAGRRNRGVNYYKPIKGSSSASIPR